MLLHSISFCVFCVRVGISDSLCSEWRDPPQSKWSKHAAMFSFSSSAVRDTSDQCRSILVSDWLKLQIEVARPHIRFRLTRARLSFLHIRSQLRSLTVGDQAYSKSNVPEKTPLRLSPRKTGLMRNSMLSRSKKSRSQINNLDSPCPTGRQIKIWSLGNQVSAPISRARSHNFEEWDSRAGGRCVIIFINFKSDPLSFSTFSNPTNFHHSSWTCPTLRDTISIYFEQDSKGKKMISIFIGPESDHWLCLSVTH